MRLTITILTLVAISSAATAADAHFAMAWQGYVEDTIATPRQPDCVPRMYAANPAVERRGAVVMFHGFGGCPQQFFEVAEIVSAAGFDVLLPLSPGHGMVPAADGTEDLSRVPDGATWTRYAEFAARMNDIMAKSSGTKVVVGFSLGGAMALHAALRSPERYDRMLLLAPMLAIAGGGFVSGAVEVLGRTPGVREMTVKPFGIRDECKRWTEAGRAGFCDYRLDHTVALVEIGDRNDELLADTELPMRVQIIGAGDEKYVSNGKMDELANGEAERENISLCFLPEDVPHEMLTRYENVGREMYWLEGLLGRVAGFIAAGEPVPVTRPGESGSPKCRL
ncbi:MAG: alpha/beta fold hydrolase [Gammaproteobacteria bacterium]